MTNHRDRVCEFFDRLWPEYKKKLNVEKPLMIDVGCTDDRLKAYFEEKGFTWTGFDPFPGHESVIQGRMEEMWRISEQEYDLVFVCHAFEHCERPLDALRHFKRILKPGGLLFMATPFNCKHHILGADDDHISVFNDMQLYRMIYHVGFKDIEVLIQQDYRGMMIEKEQDFNILSVGWKR